jgi:hypothetical protein
MEPGNVNIALKRLKIERAEFWLYSHGRWRIIDEEYECQKTSMRLLLRMWLAAYAFHVILILAV